ncbi:MAG: hypothetical protein HY266_09265 [Deltaproteobacteria bacterium]|nr:hypothetical protein [Deltaproteobacteria bacterium]
MNLHIRIDITFFVKTSDIATGVDGGNSKPDMYLTINGKAEVIADCGLRIAEFKTEILSYHSASRILHLKMPPILILINLNFL